MFPGIFNKLRMPDRDWGWRSRRFKISCRVLQKMMMWRVCSGPLLQESCLLTEVRWKRLLPIVVVPMQPVYFLSTLTYNVGNFYVTATSYQNRMFIHNQTGRVANHPGPVMFHVKQDASLFFYLANTLLETKHEFEKVRYVGGDRSQSQKAFLKPLNGAKFLPCKKTSERWHETEDAVSGNSVSNETYQRTYLEVLEMEKKGLLTLVSRLNLTKGFKSSRLCGIPNSGTISSPMLLMTWKTEWLQKSEDALECQNFRYKQKIEEAKKEKEPGDFGMLLGGGHWDIQDCAARGHK